MNDAAAVALLTGAVSIPSHSGQEAALAEWLTTELASLLDYCGIDAAGNFVGTLGAGPIRLYCLGHIDTVPGQVPVRLEDGILWGRGSVDAKGSFCSHIAGVIRAFAAEPGLRERVSVTLIGAVGEEAAESAGARHALTSLPPPDLLLIGEPSGWQSLTLGYKGRLQLKLSAVCPEAHSAGQAPSAADCLLAVYQELRAASGRLLPTANSGAFGSVQMTVTGLASSSDGLEQQAEATVSIRLPPGVSAGLAADELSRAAVAAGLAFENCRIGVAPSGGVDAVLAARDSSLSRAFRAAIRRNGGLPAFKLKTGTSDMNVVAPVWQAPALAYGPGDSSLDHTPFERVAVGEYLAAVEVVAAAVTLLGNSGH